MLCDIKIYIYIHDFSLNYWEEAPKISLYSHFLHLKYIKLDQIYKYIKFNVWKTIHRYLSVLIDHIASCLQVNVMVLKPNLHREFQSITSNY